MFSYHFTPQDMAVIKAMAFSLLLIVPLCFVFGLLKGIYTMGALGALLTGDPTPSF